MTIPAHARVDVSASLRARAGRLAAGELSGPTAGPYGCGRLSGATLADLDAEMLREAAMRRRAVAAAD